MRKLISKYFISLSNNIYSFIFLYSFTKDLMLLLFVILIGFKCGSNYGCLTTRDKSHERIFGRSTRHCNLVIAFVG